MIDYGVDIPNYLECMPNSLFTESMEYGERKTKSGFVIQAESMDHQGRFVRPRWSKVRYKADNIDFVNIGDWVLMEHGHWSFGMHLKINGKEEKLWYISPKSLREGLIAISHTIPSELKEYGIEE